MRGGGTPWENLSALGGPPLVSKMLIGTGTRARPKTATPARNVGVKFVAVGKTLRGSRKAQNIKVGIYIYMLIKPKEAAKTCSPSPRTIKQATSQGTPSNKLQNIINGTTNIYTHIPDSGSGSGPGSTQYTGRTSWVNLVMKQNKKKDEESKTEREKRERERN